MDADDDNDDNNDDAEEERLVSLDDSKRSPGVPVHQRCVRLDTACENFRYPKMASNVANLILLSFEKSFEVEIDFAYSANVCRSAIARVSSVPIDSQRLVFRNQMVCDEDATIQVLQSCIEANKKGRSAVRAVLLDVSKKVETSGTMLSALSVLNKLSVYQCEQALALATMANQNNMQNMQSMMSRLRGNAQQAMSYEEKHMQIEALKVVPLLDLYERAFKSENPKTSFSDELLCQLLAWFKFRFFIHDTYWIYCR